MRPSVLRKCRGRWLSVIGRKPLLGLDKAAGEPRTADADAYVAVQPPIQLPGHDALRS
jgi:hypothetical protein